MTDYLTMAEVLAMHVDQIERYGGTDGVRDRGLLDSALYRPQTGYYADLIEEAAALWESLAQNHPFVDGNGRSARLLSTLCLYRTGYDFKRLFTISEYYDRDRPAYYKALQGVRERGMNMTGWLEYFTEGLGAQMRDVQMTAEHVMRKDVVLAKARKNGLKERPVAILGYLLTAGKATVAECGEELKMNRRTLQRDLKLLVEKGLVREVGTGPTDPTKHYEPLL